MLVSSLKPQDMRTQTLLQGMQGSYSFAGAQTAAALVKLPGVHKEQPRVHTLSSADSDLAVQASQGATAAAFGDDKGNRHTFVYTTTRAGSSLLHAVAVEQSAAAPAGIRDIAVVSGGEGYGGSTATYTTAPLGVSCVAPCVGRGLAGVCRVFNGSVYAVDVLERGSGYSGVGALGAPNVSCVGGAVNAQLSATVSQPSYLFAEGAGTQFTCFTGTKVQALTPKELQDCSRPTMTSLTCVLRVCQRVARRVAAEATQFTCCISTKVQILTQKTLYARW
jgi:hypothetical protein